MNVDWFFRILDDDIHRLIFLNKINCFFNHKLIIRFDQSIHLNSFRVIAYVNVDLAIKNSTIHQLVKSSFAHKCLKSRDFCRVFSVIIIIVTFIEWFSIQLILNIEFFMRKFLIALIRRFVVELINFKSFSNFFSDILNCCSDENTRIERMLNRFH